MSMKQNTTPTLETQIREILDKRFYGFGGALKERVWDYRGATDDLLSLLQSEKLKAVREVVPVKAELPEIDKEINPDELKYIRAKYYTQLGWNQCRSAILKKIEGL